MPSISDTAWNLSRMDPERLVRALADQTGVSYWRADRGEPGAWRNSVPALLRLLCDAGLGHVQVLLEYRLPYSPYRVDALLCGVHPETGQASYVLVELKQWSYMREVSSSLVLSANDARRPDLHPVEQVRRYCRYLLDYIPSLARVPGTVKGIAYLHNLTEPIDHAGDDFGRLYTAEQKRELVAELTALLDSAPGSAEAAEKAVRDLNGMRRSPTRTLLKTAAGVFAGRQGYVLLDAQKIAYELVLRAVKRADHTGGVMAKTVIVVRGGPGSGKSAIAIELLSAFAERREKVLHATGSKAFTETLRREVAGDLPRPASVFKYFNNFDGLARNSLDVLICDEAHRIRDNYAPQHWWDRDPPQVAKLIEVAKVPVFLLDDNQKVRPKESHTAARIAEVAGAKGYRVLEVDLGDQFRCGGSAHYDEWVLRLLGIGGREPVPWSEFVSGTDDEYVVDSVGTPAGLEAWLERQRGNFGGTARIAAGYCWYWSDPVEDDNGYRLVDDVKIGEWRRPWNVRHGKESEGFPSASYWASDADGAGQIGCIYTAQGFEYDWAGVIFGKDLVMRDGKWQPQPRKSWDGAVNRTKPETFIELTRNTYKVLMTRGMQGVCLYSEDPETNEFFRKYCR